MSVPVPERKNGVLAQLVERQVRNLEVRGSNPLCSTITNKSELLPFGLGFGFVVSVEEIENREDCRLRRSSFG